MTDFLTADTNLPSYMMFPRFLLDMEINETRSEEHTSELQSPQ